MPHKFSRFHKEGWNFTNKTIIPNQFFLHFCHFYLRIVVVKIMFHLYQWKYLFFTRIFLKINRIQIINWVIYYDIL